MAEKEGSVEAIVRMTRRVTRKMHSAEGEVRTVLEGASG
jgi:hypothetical protein